MSSFSPAAQAYRFYEDGTESGSSPIDAQDTAITRLVDSNSQVHLRYRLQETGGKSGATTDDYTLQYSDNGGTSWTTITTSSAKIQCDTGSSLSNGTATTNRGTNGISDGTGSFIAGVQEEDNGEITNWQLTASNFTEHVWALLFIASALPTNGEVITFRMRLNGGSPGMTNSITPQVTVTKTATAAIYLSPTMAQLNSGGFVGRVNV